MLVFALGMLALAVVATGLLYYRRQLRLKNQQQQAFTLQLLHQTEEERKRIAMDLHDGISHDILALSYSIPKEFEHIKNKIITIIENIRKISHNLHPTIFEKANLQESIEQLAEQIQESNSIFISTDIHYNNQLTRFQELQIYRIIQEALSNTLKHARAEAVRVQMLAGHQQLWVQISDNGQGFDLQQALAGKALGLRSIEQRCQAIGGISQIVSSAKGTTITLHLPFP